METGQETLSTPPADTSPATSRPGGTQTEEPTPPPYDPEELQRDMTLLRTIGNHPQAAHFLAELAGGAEPAELVRSFFPELFTGSGTDSDDKETENTAEQETAMFRSRMDHPQPEASCPTFLAHMRKGFWD